MESKVNASMHWAELSGAVRGDPLFRDFFNKFCCLPVFGQKLAFLKDNDKFLLDPPPLRGASRRARISNEHVWHWAVCNRMELFVRSTTWSDYSLCRHLLDMPFSVSKSQSPSNSESFEELSGVSLLDRLRKQKLRKATDYRKFARLVEKSKNDCYLIKFWVDADRLRLGESAQKVAILRAIQQKYFAKTSPHCLPSVFLDAVYPDRTVNDCRGFDLDRTRRLKNLVLRRLHGYWLPRYLATSRNDLGPVEKLKLKKIAAVLGLRNEANAAAAALLHSPYARTIPDPDVAFKEAQVQPSEYDYGADVDEEKENILVKEPSGAEIWEEENHLLRVMQEHRGRHGSEMLGSENIEFIHEHIFGKDHTKTIAENEESSPTDTDHHPGPKETYQLFPGRIVSVKAEDSDVSVARDVTLPEVRLSQDPSSPDGRVSASDANERGLFDVAVTQSTADAPEVTRLSADVERVAKSLSRLDEEEEEQLFERFRQRSFDLSSENVIQHHTAPDLIAKDSPRKSKSECAVAPPSKPRSPVKRPHGGSVKPIEQSRSKTSSCSLPCLPSQSSLTETDSELNTSSDPASDYDTTCTSASKSISSSQDDVTTASKSSEKCAEAKEDFLRRVEEGLAFSEVLASDEPAGFPLRRFLARRDADRVAQGDVGGEAVLDSPRMLDLWRRLEEMRLTYFALDSAELNKRLRMLRHHFRQHEELRPDDVRMLVSALDALHNDSTYPEQWSRFQRRVEEAVQSRWEIFAAKEQSSFKNMIITTEQRVYPRRHSFPNLPSEIRVLPILRVPVDNASDQQTSKVRHRQLATLGYGGEGHMRYRVSRAYRVLTTSRGSPLRHDVRYSEFVGEDSSDEEGNMPPLKPKVFAKLPNINPKTVAMHSAKEYPRQGIDYGIYKIFRVIKRHTVDTRPVYMRPIRKHGVILRRPSERPRHLLDVLRDPLHFEFFKRYMKMHKSEAPLLFWKSVELLRRTENPFSRQQKAQQILKKFFGRLAGGGMMLQCDSEVIQEIAVVETVTTSMLVQASHEVYKSMEKNWANRYFSTFPQPESPDEELDALDGKLGMYGIKTKLLRIWEIFSEFMRRAARFISCMRDAKEFENFRAYLASLPKRKYDTIAGGDASSTAVAFKRFQTVVYKHLNTDVTYKYTNKKLFGRKITLDFLPNDLAFWLEADRYVTMSDNVQQLIFAGCYDERDNELVAEKSQRIVKCFLDSYVPPQTRVNLDKEIATAITKNVQGGIKDRGIFHEAVLYIFPVLLYFWKQYRFERFRYVSKKTLRDQHRETVRERGKREVRHAERRKRKSLKISTTSIETVVSRKSSSSRFPDYVNGLMKKKQPYERVKGLLHSDPPTLHFTLEHGLKLILPPRRRLVDRLGHPDEDEDEQFLMNVWTRGAKVVNVIREGSDPKLIDLDDRKKAFRVKCDLIEK